MWTVNSQEKREGSPSDEPNQRIGYLFILNKKRGFYFSHLVTKDENALLFMLFSKFKFKVLRPLRAHDPRLIPSPLHLSPSILNLQLMGQLQMVNGSQ